MTPPLASVYSATRWTTWDLWPWAVEEMLWEPPRRQLSKCSEISRTEELTLDELRCSNPMIY